MVSDSQLSPRQSTELLGGLDELKHGARRGTGAPWLPLALFGGFTTLTSPLAAAFGMPSLGLAWTIGGIVALVAVVRHYRRRMVRTGISGRSPQLLALAVFIFLTSFVIAAIAGPAGRHAGPLLGPPLVVLVGYGAFGWYQRSPAVAFAAVPGVAITAGLFAIEAAPPLVLLAFGLGQLFAGAYLRWREAAG